MKKEKYQNFLSDCIRDMVTGVNDFDAKGTMLSESLDPKSVTQDLFNESKGYSDETISDKMVQDYCKKALGIELNLEIANENHTKKLGANENHFEQTASNIMNRVEQIQDSFSSYNEEEDLEIEIDPEEWKEINENSLKFEQDTSELLDRTEKIINEFGGKGIELDNKSSQNLENPSTVEQDLDTILNRTENIENQFTNQEDAKLAIRAIERRTEQLLGMVDDLEKQAATYKEQGLGLDSLEVKALLKNCEDISTETMGLKGKYEGIQALPQQELAVEKLGDTMQVIVVNDKGFYKELGTELNPDKFLSPLEVEKIAEGLSQEYPESKLMVIEVDRKKYMGIEGLSFVVAEKKDTLLKAEGDVKGEYKIPKQQVKTEEKKKGSSQKKKNDDLDKVAAKSDKNILDILFSWTKLGWFICRDFVVGSVELGKEARQGIKELRKEKATINNPDTIQVLVLQQSDGSVNEVMSQQNKDLFMRPDELKAYVESLTKDNGKYRLLELSAKDTPDINLYTTKGVLTPEGKKKYHSAKSEFLKGTTKDVASYEVSGRVEPKKEKKKKKKEEHKTKQQKTPKQSHNHKNEQNHKQTKSNNRGMKR